MKEKDVNAVELAQKQRHLYLLGKVNRGQHLTKAEIKELRDLESVQKPGSGEKPGQRKKGRPSGIASDEIIEGQTLAAKYAGVSTRTIRNWVKEGMPRTEAGHYIKSMLDFYRTNEGSQPTEAKKRSQDADAGIKEKKDKLLQMQLDEKQRDFEAELERALVQRALILKRALMGQGRKLGPQLANTRDARKCQKIIDDDNRAIIEGFAG